MNVQDWVDNKNLLWESRDQAYWKGVYEKANEECEGFVENVRIGTKEVPVPSTWNYATSQTTTEHVYKEVQVSPATYIRQKRWERRKPTPKKNTYGKEIDRWLIDQLNEASQDADCVDNYRFAEKSNRADMRRFRRKTGCCGSYIAEVTWKTWFGRPRIFVIGFNYGH